MKAGGFTDGFTGKDDLIEYRKTNKAPPQKTPQSKENSCLPACAYTLHWDRKTDPRWFAADVPE